MRHTVTYEICSLTPSISTMLNIQNLQLEQTRVYQEIQEKVQTKDRQELIIKLLTKRFGELSEPIQAKIAILSSTQLEALLDTFLDFEGLVDLEEWLADR
jgi:predicted transposase YdaD